MTSQISKVILIILAAIGALALVGIFSMMFMHGAMMGGTSFKGLGSSMMQGCYGMMGPRQGP
ncbi:MAG: hypothetical protein V4632_06825 [Pseudomonadota bacterium]